MPNRLAGVICTCFQCAIETVTNDFDQRQPGKRVPISTMKYHRKRDQERRPIGPTLPNPLIAPLPQPANPAFVPVMLQQQTPARATNEGGNRIDAIQKSLFMTVCTLAAWLHLVCGLSRGATSQLLKVLGFIVQTAIKLGGLLSLLRSGEDSNVTLPPFHLPRDIRSAMSALSIEPNIIRSICCPKCFSKYSLDSLPQICLRRETERAKPCGEKLWTTRSTRGGPRRVPCRLYSTQDFESWLEFFLSRPGIEDIIDESYTHKSSTNELRSILDSPAWKSLGTFSSTPGNLTFSYYVDWFNPFTNKISGKSVSCGAIMMFCLNLPFDIQHLPENTFFAGITPPPKEPTMTTITAVADPIIDRLKPMWHGKPINTYRHPRGIQKRVALLARIGDLLAIRKALGFAGVTSHHFCSFCKLLYADKDNLDYSSWEMRNGREVMTAATEWKDATTKTKRKEIFNQHGVRWSSLHGLPYGDPVLHTLLGIMHNWMEGVLQHHARVWWGIGITPSIVDDNDDALGQTTTGPHPLNNLPDFNFEEDVLDETETLFQESQPYQDSPSHIARLHSEASMLVNEESDAEDVDFQPDSDSNSEDGEDNDHSWEATCIFTAAELSSIRSCLSDVVIPTWVERPPTNLGEKSHGKLKADQWFILFSIFLPLVLPEIWGKSINIRHNALLTNFHNLVTCTNIVCAYSVKPHYPRVYLDHYVEYRKSSQTLFPNSGSRPNHHYAMHNAQLMMFWGPLMRLGEFAGERHNGSLQNIKTNNHLWEIDFTMLRQICRRGRLMAFLRNNSLYPMPSEMITKATDILLQKPGQKEDPNGAGLKAIPSEVYDAILAHLNGVSSSDPPFRHAGDLPHPDNARVLPRVAVPVRWFKHKGRDYSTIDMHPGNSSVHIVAKKKGLDCGQIKSIWKCKLDNAASRMFIVLSLHQSLSPEDALHNPYQSRPGFLANVVYTHSCDSPPLILEQDDIIGHIAYYSRPPGTFGISSATTVLINSLHRDRD